MGSMLPDGTIIPSYMGSEPMGKKSKTNAFNNFTLRQGEVRTIIYPDDPKSVSKKYVEYAVAVQVRDGSGPAVTVNYPNCVVANLFGGVADKLRYTYRAQTSEPEKGKVVADGSKVLVLCVNGELRKAFIVGGINEDPTKEKKDDGHHLFFEFNGTQISINKDGELQIRYRGPTDITGKLASGEEDSDSNTSGATVIFTKEGGIKAYTKDEKQFIHLDHDNKKIDVLADEEWHVKVNKKLVFEMGDTMQVTGKSTCTIEMSDKVFIKSAGVHVGGASEAWMMGSTFRQSQSTMHQTMSGLLNTLAGLVTTAATNLQIASAAHKVPIVGPIVGSVPLQLAATALNSAGPLFSQLGSAITTFEGQGSSYLSTKNKND